MATRSAVLGTTRLTGTTAVALYIVPAGEVWILKGLLLSNTAGGVVTVQAYMSRSPSPKFGLVLNDTLGAGARLDWNGWVVGEAGDAFNISTTIAGLDVWASGAKLKVTS